MTDRERVVALVAAAGGLSASIGTFDEAEEDEDD